MEQKSKSSSVLNNELLFLLSSALLLVMGVLSVMLSSSILEKHQSSLPSVVFIPNQEEFSCGGGPFSFYMASLVSTTCDRPKIHSCCAAHDICYESLHLNQSYCDEIFCGCLGHIESSLYCESVAQPSLCLATQVFGHLFHWSANCTSPGQEGCQPVEIDSISQDRRRSVDNMVGSGSAMKL